MPLKGKFGFIGIFHALLKVDSRVHADFCEHSAQSESLQKRAGGRVAGGERPLGVFWGEIFFNFQVKNAGFYAFYCEKLYLSPETGTRGAGL